MDERIEELASRLTGTAGPIELIVLGDPVRSEIARRFGTLARHLEAHAERRVIVGEGGSEDPPTDGGLTIRSVGCGRMTWTFFPEGPQWTPFAGLCEAIARGERDRELDERLAVTTSPVTVEVLVGRSCPHCPAAVTEALRLARSCALVDVVIMDAQACAGIAGRYRVSSVPATVIGGEVRLTGIVRASTLARHVLGLGSEESARAEIDSLVEHGEVDALVERMGHERGARLFADAWRRSVMSSRITMMMAAENLLDGAPRALDGIVPALVDATNARDASLRGDTADLLGRIGHPSSRQALESLLGDVNPDVAEIARDALDEMSVDGNG